MPTGKATRELQIFDPLLTDVARQYSPSGFVYDEIAPHIPVKAISGQYPVFDERYFFGDDVETKVGDRSETPEIELVWSTESYLCEDYALMASITPRERQQTNVTGDAIRLEASKTKQVQTRMALRRERRLAAELRKTTNGGQLNLGAAAGTAWATSTAIESDVKTAKLAVYNATGQDPNVLLLPYGKAYDMATNATLRDIFKYTVNAQNVIKLGQGDDGEDILLPRYFHGLRIVIPKGALYHQGNVKATKSLAEIWGSSARFLYVNPDAGWGEPSVAYSFWHPALTVEGDGGSGPVVDTWSEKNPVKDLYRVTECVDEKICAPDLGYELTGV